MNKYRVRVPVAGYVDIDVEANTKRQAIQKARIDFKWSLNPREEVVDLNAFHGCQEVNLSIFERVEIYESQEDVDQNNYYSHNLGVTSEQQP